VLLAVGAIFMMTWLYAMRDGNPYGGETHLLLAASIVAVGLHFVLQKRNPVQPITPSAGEHRAAATLLNPSAHAGLEGGNPAKLPPPKQR